MTAVSDVRSRRELFTLLDAYVSDRSEEIVGDRRLKHELVKSYLLETSADRSSVDLVGESLEEAKWRIRRVDEGLYQATDREGINGYLEALDERYYAFYLLDASDRCDRAVSRLVSKSVIFDRLWFSGVFLQALWKQVSEAHEGHRFTRMKFEFDDLYGLIDYEDPLESEADIARLLEVTPERRGSVFALTDRISRARERLPQFRTIEEAFYDMTLLRLPAVGSRGGHDVYYTGKVTNHATSFIEHRQQLLGLVGAYRSLNATIEESVSLSIAANGNDGLGSVTIRGAPVTFRFPSPLSPDVFENFVRSTFEQGRAPFRILGKPIRVSDGAYHVYGVDMHLWQEIWISLTRAVWVLVLPEGTCGNTVSRFTANIQRFIDPRVDVFIGEAPMASIVARALH